jgi:zinc transport system substrate-binding protein
MSRTAAAALLALALVLTACSGGDGRQARAGGQLRVATAFYPLQFVAERVGGDDAVVEDLTSAGTEPHDVELTPRQVGRLSQDDLVVHLRGFQPAVDTAVEQQARNALDVATVVPLQDGYVPLDEGVARREEQGVDPHVWLDPRRFAAIGDAVAARMGELAPDRAAAFRERAAQLRTELEALDGAFRTGLSACARRQLVTSHNAFGYLAQAYGLEQVSITGLTPESEPTPGRLAEVARLARAGGVTTVFFEELVSPAVAQALAAEVGARAVELSPLESAPESGDYLSTMRSNLAALQEALGCSTP